MKHLVFILGMHRSGTSLLARAINLLGVPIPGTVLPAAADNPKGYWEPKELVALNNATLAALDRPWYDDRPLDPDRVAAERGCFLERAVPMLEGWLAANELLALKDPRLCRLLPLWSAAARRLGCATHVLVILRHPPAVAESLRRRWDDAAFRPAAVVQQERSLLLWLRYVLEAEQHSRGMRRAWLTYEALLDAPALCMKRSIETLGVAPPRPMDEAAAELAALANRSLQRSHPTPRSGPEWRIAEELYQAVRRCTGRDLDAETRRHFAGQRQALAEINERYRAARRSIPPANQSDLRAPGIVRAFANRALAAELHAPEGVLFVTGAPLSKGHIYRVQYRVEALLGRNIPAAVLPFDSPELLTGARAAGLVLVYRCEWDEALCGLYRYCRRAAIPVGFDIDDLLFDPRCMTPEHFDFLRRPDVSEQEWVERAGRYQQALREADFAILTTEPLRQAAQSFVPCCYVAPNGLGKERVAAAQRIARRSGAGGGLRIGYASGTPTHQRDFGQIVAPLMETLEAHPRVILTILGHLDLREFPQLPAFADRIEQRPEVPFERLPDELSRFAINLAPLQIGNPFCEAKSALKYFEAGLVGVPSIASATAPMRAAILQGETGYCCETAGQWRTHLDRLIGDAEHRSALGRQARTHALAEYGPEAQRDAFLAVLAEALRGHEPKSRAGRLLRKLRKAFA